MDSAGEAPGPLVKADTHMGVLQWCSDLHPAEPEPDGPLSTDPGVAVQQQARAGWGLPSDEASTRAAMKAPDASREWGFATTPQESAELHTSRAGGHKAARAEQYGRQHPDQFAGLWVDQSKGGVVTVAFTEDLDRHHDALQAELASDPVAVVHAEHTEAELNAARARIEDDFGDESDGIPWSSLATDVIANRVAIGLARVDEDVVRTLGDRYGDMPVCIDAVGEFRPVLTPGQ